MREIAIIKKEGNKWCVYSEKTDKKFGCYNTKKEAVERLAQIEYYKTHKAGRYECYCEECGYEFVSYQPCHLTRCPFCGDDAIEEITGEH